MFTIAKVQSTNPWMYKIKDWKGEEVAGTFYEPELQKSKQTVFRVEKVLRRRVKNNRKEVYVKWKGYPNTFNSWISFDKDVEKYGS